MWRDHIVPITILSLRSCWDYTWLLENWSHNSEISIKWLNSQLQLQHRFQTAWAFACNQDAYSGGRFDVCRVMIKICMQAIQHIIMINTSSSKQSKHLPQFPVPHHSHMCHFSSYVWSSTFQLVQYSYQSQFSICSTLII